MKASFLPAHIEPCRSLFTVFVTDGELVCDEFVGDGLLMIRANGSLRPGAAEALIEAVEARRWLVGLVYWLKFIPMGAEGGASSAYSVKVLLAGAGGLVLPRKHRGNRPSSVVGQPQRPEMGDGLLMVVVLIIWWSKQTHAPECNAQSQQRHGLGHRRRPHSELKIACGDG